MPIGTIPPPTTTIDSEPTFCLEISQSWLPALLAIVNPARYPEFWAGTLEENRFARLQAKQLLIKLQELEECGSMAICCEPAIYIYRQNGETGRLERSSDGGTTWTPDPSDPIYKTTQLPAPVTEGGSTTKCDAATNFTTHFQDAITGCSENLGTATTLVQLAGGIAALALDILIIIIFEAAAPAIIATITSAIFAGISAAFAEGKTAFDAYWSSDNIGKILCAAYCTIGDNGQFSQTQWEDFKHRARLDLPPGAALDMVLTTVNAAGYVGANNMASYGTAADSDCASCVCDESLHVFVSDRTGSPNIEIFPDEDGVYTAVQSGVAHDGYYYADILFSFVENTTTFEPCAALTLLTGSPAYEQKNDCHTGTNNPLSTCTYYYTFRDPAPFTITFTAVQCT